MSDFVLRFSAGAARHGDDDRRMIYAVISRQAPHQVLDVFFDPDQIGDDVVAELPAPYQEGFPIMVKDYRAIRNAASPLQAIRNMLDAIP